MSSKKMPQSVGLICHAGLIDIDGQRRGCGVQHARTDQHQGYSHQSDGTHDCSPNTSILLDAHDLHTALGSLRMACP